MNQSLYEWLAEEPFTLSMSSGFFSFFAHLGMMKALEHSRLFPSRLTGSSAGALTAACWAAHHQCAPLEDELLKLEREAFWDPAPGLGLLRGDKFRSILARVLATDRFNELKSELAVSVWSLDERKTRVINEGNLIEAVYASCAVPFLFQPARLQGLCWDGGIADRHGLAGTGANERVFYHHIASRSPWRKKNSIALAIPQRNGLYALKLEGLPRSGPGKLDQGRSAINLAYEATLRALEQKIDETGLASLHV